MEMENNPDGAMSLIYFTQNNDVFNSSNPGSPEMFAAFDLYNNRDKL